MLQDKPGPTFRENDEESSDSDTEIFVVPRVCDMPSQVPQVPDELSNPPHAEEVYDSKDAKLSPDVNIPDDIHTQHHVAPLQDTRNMPTRKQPVRQCRVRNTLRIL